MIGWTSILPSTLKILSFGNQSLILTEILNNFLPLPCNSTKFLLKCIYKQRKIFKRKSKNEILIKDRPSMILSQTTIFHSSPQRLPSTSIVKQRVWLWKLNPLTKLRKINIVSLRRSLYQKND